VTTRRWIWWSLGGGFALAALYTISPLTICVVVAGATILPRLTAGLPREEHRWLTGILVLSLVARLLTIGVVFARNLPKHESQFVGATSGDEAYAMSRALRTRNIVRGLTTDKYDYFVAFDEYGQNSFVAALGVVQVIFGPTPYSLRLLNTLLFTIGVLLLYRLCRDAFGPSPALGGLTLALFWPSLFVWSISLLKEPLYFVFGAIALTAAIGALRAPPWRSRTIIVAVGLTAAVLARDLRPGALLLMGSGLLIGGAAYVASSSRRAFVVAVLSLTMILALGLSYRGVEARLMAGLESAAKTHSGHVFTVGHSYKLLDDGFYVNPQPPIASTLTLTRDEAARFVVRAAASFLAVPTPWQLQSAREVAYLPEQVAWYGLLVLLPIGVAAGFRRDRLVTCMLVGYVMPTALALALTNGNVGTLLRLRGLVVPYLVWIGAMGFFAALGALGREKKMGLIDEEGRVFGRVNLFDAAVIAFAIVLIPVAYGTFLLFRTPALHISSVRRVPITKEERRVAGGSGLTAKLKVQGSGLRPMLRASIDSTQAIGFVFENPNSADVLVGRVPPGTHDLVLYDGVQEVGRLVKSVTIEATAPPRVSVVGTLVNLDKATADSLGSDAAFRAGPEGAVRKLGEARPQADGRWQRPLAIVLQCDPDPSDEGCAVGGIALSSKPGQTLKLPGLSGADLSFAVSELFPSAAPTTVRARVRFSMAPELTSLVHAGDRDDCLDDRAAIVDDVGGRRAGGTELDVAMHLGADQSPEGLRYRGQLLRAGAPFTLTTDRYVVTGTVLTVGARAEGDPR
jgi:hypothetical protein